MRYSYFIKSLKYLLITISFAILFTLVFKGISFEEKTGNLVSFEDQEFSAAKQILSKPLFIGIDKKKQPFRISAKKATRFNSNQDIFNLEEPEGEIETESDKFFMQGNFGVFNNKEQILEIEGNVKFRNKDSLNFNTSEAKFDFKKEILSGNKKIIGKKDNSTIISEGFKMINKENKIIFTGKSHLILSSK
tara:strand:+ start:1388 stop:1960 length:573 start_codon:yes stop_codon:yes gene_type:complete